MKIECTKKEWELMNSIIIFSECSSSTDRHKSGCHCIIDLKEKIYLDIDVIFEK